MRRNGPFGGYVLSASRHWCSRSESLKGPQSGSRCIPQRTDEAANLSGEIADKTDIGFSDFADAALLCTCGTCFAASQPTSPNQPFRPVKSCQFGTVPPPHARSTCKSRTKTAVVTVYRGTFQGTDLCRGLRLQPKHLVPRGPVVCARRLYGKLPKVRLSGDHVVV